MQEQAGEREAEILESGIRGICEGYGEKCGWYLAVSQGNEVNPLAEGSAKVGTKRN